MRSPIRLLISAILALGPLAAGAEAADKIRVVTTIPDLKSLVEAVAGGRRHAHARHPELPRG